jgi:Curli production assembly/transport component CsgG
MTPGRRTKLAAVAALGAAAALAWPLVFASSAPSGLVVWDFDDQTPPGLAALPVAERAWLRRALGEQVAQALDQLPGLVLVDRLRIADLLAEQQLGSSALADQDARLRLGRLVGATRMVFGGFFALGDQVQINLRLVDVATGHISHADEVTAPASDTMAAAAALGPRLIRVLGGGGPALTAYPEPVWRELDAALALAEQKRYDASLTALQALLAKHPGFVPAERQVPRVLERMRRQ